MEGLKEIYNFIIHKFPGHKTVEKSLSSSKYRKKKKKHIPRNGNRKKREMEINRMGIIKKPEIPKKYLSFYCFSSNRQISFFPSFHQLPTKTPISQKFPTNHHAHSFTHLPSPHHQSWTPSYQTSNHPESSHPTPQFPNLLS